MTDEKKPVKKKKAVKAKAKPAAKKAAPKKAAVKKKATPKTKTAATTKAAKKTPAKKAAPKKKAPAKTKASKEKAAKPATKTAPKKKPAAKKKPATKTKTTEKKAAAAKKTPVKKTTKAKETATAKKKPAAKKKAPAKKTTAKKAITPKKTAAKKTPAKKTAPKAKKAPATKVKKETAPKKTAAKSKTTKESTKEKAVSTKKPTRTSKAKASTTAKTPTKTAKAKKPASPPKATQGKKIQATDNVTAKESPKETTAKTETVQKEKPTSSPKGEQNKRPQSKNHKQYQTKQTDKQPQPKDPSITYKLLVNADEPEECRIALLENGKVESFSVETVVRAQTKGNIYKGVITAVEPNLQAAFVDMGTGKNGFLPFSDIHPEYYCKDVGKRTHWKDLSIQSVVMKGQEVLVEVVKETTGNKGANLTTYLSMPGRYVVLMPGSDSHGISRKISNEERRRKLRDIVKSANLPEEIGYIIRTASEDITKTALMKDIRYQLDLWKEIKHNGQTMKAPAIVYKEQNVVARFLRDHFTPEINEIMVDNKDVFDKVNQFMELLPAKQRTTKVKLHRGSKPIFNQFQVEEQIEQMYQPQVPLPSGGSIVIDPTEALVAIDVNSGRTSKDKNFEKTIFLANMEAADELARQLRLRDLGGLIVVDFIDMRDKRNIREVETKLRDSLKRDKAKIDTSRISKFGLMQVSRQRLGPPIQKGNYIKCEHCQGSGIIKSVETTSLSLLRRIQTGAAKRHIIAIECELPLAISQYLLNQKRADIVSMERKYRVEIRIISNPSMTPSQEDIRFIKKDA